MGAYLIDHPPARSQWFREPRARLTGCTVLHDTESIFDAIGEDTGAENVAAWIRRRSNPGSYHDLVDSDSWVHLIPWHLAAFHDGTGSNHWALSLSFACRTVDWARMAPAKRAGMLAQGARAFAAQQVYRKQVWAPYTRLRVISKRQSDAGHSGFIGHGHRDPGRRSDPGTIPPHIFPWQEWLDACRTELGRHPGLADHPDAPQEDQLTPEQARKLDELHAWTKNLSHLVDTGRHRSFVPGSETRLRGVDFWRTADAHAYRLRYEDVPAILGELAKLRATVDTLVTERGPDVADKLRQVLRDEVVRVSVDLDLDRDDDTPAPVEG